MASAVMQRVAVLGATGSIGASALDVVARHPERLSASVLAAGSNVDGLLALCRRHRPAHAVIADPAAYPALRDGLRDAGLPTEAHAGDAALDALVAGDACDSVVAAIVGAYLVLQAGYSIGRKNIEGLDVVPGAAGGPDRVAEEHPAQAEQPGVALGGVGQAEAFTVFGVQAPADFGTVDPALQER